VEDSSPDQNFSPDSVTHWLEGLRRGESVAAQELWNRYFSRLVTLARSRLQGLSRDVSGQDIALSALNSVMIGVQEDRFPNLADRESLWPLLVTITAQKSISQQRRQLAQKRTRNLECRWEDVQDFLGTDPSPAFAMEVADYLEQLVVSLGDSSLQRIVEMKLSGFTHQEVASELGCTERTVKRKLRLIRQEWLNTADGTTD